MANLLKINDFRFVKSDPERDITMTAINNGVPFDETITTIVCERGSELCYFETMLHPSFFDNDGHVRGVGQIGLRYNKGERKLQSEVEGQDDGFAGWAPCDVRFDIENGRKDDKKADITDGDSNLKDHWEESEGYMKALYIIALFLILCIVYVFCAGILLWRQCCRDEDKESYDDTDEHNEEDSELDQVQTNEPGKARAQSDDPSFTYSVDDDGVDNNSLDFSVTVSEPNTINQHKQTSRKNFGDYEIY